MFNTFQQLKQRNIMPKHPWELRSTIYWLSSALLNRLPDQFIVHVVGCCCLHFFCLQSLFLSFIWLLFNVGRISNWNECGICGCCCCFEFFNETKINLEKLCCSWMIRIWARAISKCISFSGQKKSDFIDPEYWKIKKKNACSVVLRWYACSYKRYSGWRWIFFCFCPPRAHIIGAHNIECWNQADTNRIANNLNCASKQSN